MVVLFPHVDMVTRSTHQEVLSLVVNDGAEGDQIHNSKLMGRNQGELLGFPDSGIVLFTLCRDFVDASNTVHVLLTNVRYQIALLVIRQAAQLIHDKLAKSVEQMPNSAPLSDKCPCCVCNPSIRIDSINLLLRKRSSPHNTVEQRGL